MDKWLGKSKKRDRPPPGTPLFGPSPLAYQTYSIKIEAGDTKWDTEAKDKEKLPRCEVGAWDNKESWDPSEIISDFIDDLMGEGGKVPVSYGPMITRAFGNNKTDSNRHRREIWIVAGHAREPQRTLVTRWSGGQDHKLLGSRDSECNFQPLNLCIH